VKAELFKTLAHPARIRVLEQLRDGSARSVSLSLASASRPRTSPGSCDIAANIVQVRQDGAAVRHSVTDTRIFELLEVARVILTSSLAESGQLLGELRVPAAPGRVAGRTGIG
jgi:DNA-binding transcriptional ArsR family regulator